MDIHMLVKDVKKTQFMQSMDVFEHFKFVGHWVTTEGNPTKSASDMLEAVEPTDAAELVAVVIPGKQDAAVKDGHKVVSDGAKWGMVEDQVRALGVKITA